MSRGYLQVEDKSTHDVHRLTLMSLTSGNQGRGGVSELRAMLKIFVEKRDGIMDGLEC